ncbi:MAG: hypothetical protein OXG55_06845 [bacterium]|nr:hypothetical protein [bacterium]
MRGSRAECSRAAPCRTHHHDDDPSRASDDEHPKPPARVRPRDGSKPFVAVSMYARWLRPHETTKSKWSVGMPDGSAHRILSDLSAFIGDFDPGTHRILAAGDLNMDYKPAAADPLTARERTVFDRMTALGLEFLGPQHPNGRRAEPTPEWLPADTRNVPTYHTVARKPADANIQLDYVFASRGFHNEVTARALNTVEEWGPSDHCRLLIEVAAEQARWIARSSLRASLARLSPLGAEVGRRRVRGRTGEVVQRGGAQLVLLGDGAWVGGERGTDPRRPSHGGPVSPSPGTLGP